MLTKGRKGVEIFVAIKEAGVQAFTLEVPVDMFILQSRGLILHLVLPAWDLWESHHKVNAGYYVISFIAGIYLLVFGGALNLEESWLYV
jgi:hypothetical protein